MTLKELFLHLAASGGSNRELQEQYWEEISDCYQNTGRHYHTLSHLENLVVELEPCRQQVQDYDAMLYAVFYHDIIYDVSRSDNEEKSAALAVQRMEALNVDTERIARCQILILATHTHRLREEQDINLFTDADLSILGKPPEQYLLYCKQIRKEYRIYPDELYVPGRAKVLQHFLDMPRIYKTGHFFGLYEQQARHNIREELEQLR